MLDNVGLRYPHRASGAKAPRTLRPLPLLRFAVSATGGAHLCSIQYYLRFWLSICRTSLAVSALRIMRYCLNFLPRWGAALPPLPGLFCFLCLGPRFFFSCVFPNADGFSDVLSRRFLEFANHFLFSQFPRHVPGKVILCHVRVFSV